MSAIALEIDLHKNSHRQGPGRPEDTTKALGLIDISNKKDLKLADIGCGSGGQTITLAQNIDGHITAVDLVPEFLEELNKKAEVLGLNEKITTLEASMEQLPFHKESFDIIWSEGAIYNMGFEAGIKNWREYLKPGGFIGVSEITWTTNTRPKELEDYWKKECPVIHTASDNMKILEDQGYAIRGYFSLTKSSWMKHYYEPMETRFSPFLQRHPNAETAKRIVEAYEEEIAVYRKYNEYFSYGFYIAKKIM